MTTFRNFQQLTFITEWCHYKVNIKYVWVSYGDLYYKHRVSFNIESKILK